MSTKRLPSGGLFFLILSSVRACREYHIPLGRRFTTFIRRMAHFNRFRQKAVRNEFSFAPIMNIRYRQILQTLTFTLVLFSCNKENNSPNTPPPTEPVSKVLLKDITIPHLPSPYYHFEYNPDSTVSKVDFASGYNVYNVFFAGGRIGEMRNNIPVNQDTLRYIYDNAGKLAGITFINKGNIIYRHVFFTYEGNQIKQIDWDHRLGDGSFVTDRTLTFAFFPDGNVKTMNEHRPALSNPSEYNAITEFEQYDNKVNVEEFSLIHDGIHDHVFLFQGFHLQKNNPGKETFSGGDSLISFTVNYSYTYNSDLTPSSKTGQLQYTAGPDAGKTFQTNATYTYY